MAPGECQSFLKNADFPRPCCDWELDPKVLLTAAEAAKGELDANTFFLKSLA